MKKIFLKFNNLDPMSITCLTFWIELFKGHDLYLMCDQDSKQVDKLVSDHNLKLFRTDYTTTIQYKDLLKSDKFVNCAAVNITIFNIAQNTDWYWMIDADDTMFLTYDIPLLQKKLSTAEETFLSNNLDGLSLDFYREMRDHWSFGVCLFKGGIDYKMISQVNFEEHKKVPKNLDGCFDVLRREKKLNLKSFVLDNIMFIHTKSFKLDYVPNGVYFWKDGKIWDKHLNPEVIIL